MFSMKLRDDRIYVNCITYHSYPKITEFIFDTGAKFTCCSYDVIDDRLTETDFRAQEHKDLGGFISGSAMRFYRLRLRQFTVGNIDLGPRNVWITFDDRISDSVLGMDVLKDVIFLNPTAEGQVRLFSTREELACYCLDWRP